MSRALSPLPTRRPEPSPGPASAAPAGADLILARLDRLTDLLADRPGDEALLDRLAAVESARDEAAGALLDLADGSARHADRLAGVESRLADAEAELQRLAARIGQLEAHLSASLAEGEELAAALSDRLSAMEQCGPDPILLALQDCSSRLDQVLTGPADNAASADPNIEDALWSLSEQIAAFEARLARRLEDRGDTRASDDPAPGPEAVDTGADRVATPGWTAPATVEERVRLLLTGAMALPSAHDEPGASGA